MSGVDPISTNPMDTTPSAPPGNDPDTSAKGRTVKQITLEEGIRPIAIAAMLTCIAISLSQLIQAIIPTWPAFFFNAVMFFVSLEGFHAQQQLSQRRLTTEEKFRFHFVEWVVILLIIRFGGYFGSSGSGQLAADMARWSAKIGSFFDVGFIVKGLLAAMFWGLGFTLSRAMQELEASPLEVRPSVTDPNHYLHATMPHQGRIDRQARLNRITTIFFGGGAVLLVLAGLAQVDVRELIVLSHSRSSGIILNVLVYFIIGFLIISQAQYTIHKANWQLQRIPILGQVGKRWVTWVLAFLLGVGLISAILPVSYSVGVLEALFAAVRWVTWLLVQIGFGFLFIISYLVGLIMSLFSGNPTSSPPPTMQRAQPPPPPPTVANEPASWWLLLRSLIFWTVLAGVVGYSLYHFARDRWQFVEGLTIGRFIAWLSRAWKGFSSGARRAATRLRDEIDRRIEARRARRRQQPWRYVSVQRLNPRDRVRYFYLSILHQSRRQGFGRPATMTPHEYRTVLEREMPEATEQIDELTEAFVEARYSEHNIDKERAGIVRAVWGRVKRALVARRRRGATLQDDGSS